MHDVLRQRLLRKIESLPDEQIYQALDYVEFLEARYGRGEAADEITGLQRFAERLEDGLRRRTVSPGTLREAFQLLAAADRVLSGVTSAGRDLLDELNGVAGGRESSRRHRADEDSPPAQPAEEIRSRGDEPPESASESPP